MQRAARSATHPAADPALHAVDPADPERGGLIARAHARSAGFGLDAHHAPGYDAIGARALGELVDASRDLYRHALPVMETLDNCVARLDRQILRAPGNWAVFSSRSGAVIQVKCTDDGRLWLETPDPATKQSPGRTVTVEEAATLLEILAREDRSAVADLSGTETVHRH